MSTENTKRPANPTFRTLDISAELTKMWGAQFSAPEPSYEFADGKRKFNLVTGDASIYKSSPDF